MDEPTSKGTVAHRVLQYLNFAEARDASSVASELQDMVLRGVLTADECRAVDQEALTWFLRTPLAEKIRSAKDAYRRELRFVTSEPVRVIDPSTMADEGDRVLVRGVVDGIIVGAGALEVIDFKTDAVTEEELEARSAHYSAQIEVYARAAERLWRSPVRACHLVFLTPRRIVSRQFASDKPEQSAAPAGQQMFSWMSP
jgi:ATP-dependent helicase/nuclease subunit A